MRYRFKNIYSWILMLIMTIGAVPGAMAIDFSQNQPMQKCAVMQMSLSDTSDMKADGNCPMEPGERNGIDAECTMPCDFTSLQAPHTTLLVARSGSQQKTLIGNDAIMSHYPDLLKRPPKA